MRREGEKIGGAGWQERSLTQQHRAASVEAEFNDLQPLHQPVCETDSGRRLWGHKRRGLCRQRTAGDVTLSATAPRQHCRLHLHV